MKKFDKILVLALMVLLVSCETNDISGVLVSSSPTPDARFDKSMEWNNAHEYPVLKVPDSYRVYVCSDTHIQTTTDKFSRFVSAYKHDSNCKFAVHLGDLVSGKEHHKLVYSVMQEPIFTIVGNHDLHFAQWSSFVEYWHTSTYYVETVSETSGRKLDLFIFLDSGNGTLGSKQMDWLRELLMVTSGYRNIIVCTHTDFFQGKAFDGNSANYPLEETYTLTNMFRQYGVKLVLTGHKHNWDDVTFAGVRYLTLESLKDDADNTSYVVVSVGNELNFEKIPLK
ncbi:MAG: metallophosphoesterase [Paludibacteraceae bacterium]|nr:metallophosphoesterase [Paludibacteraceae bacterium]